MTLPDFGVVIKIACAPTFVTLLGSIWTYVRPDTYMCYSDDRLFSYIHCDLCDDLMGYVPCSSWWSWQCTATSSKAGLDPARLLPACHCDECPLTMTHGSTRTTYPRLSRVRPTAVAQCCRGQQHCKSEARWYPFRYECPRQGT